MISKKMEKAFVGQINNEMFSAYLYMAMSAHTNHMGLKGISKWFMVQYHEEMVHAMKMYEYVISRGGKVKLLAIKEPQSEWKTVLEMFEATYAHEQFITKCINDLTDLAIAEKDHAAQVFLQWYVNEQVEEENNDTEIIGSLKIIKDSAEGMFMLDKDLGARAVTVPTDFSAGVAAAMKAAG